MNRKIKVYTSIKSLKKSWERLYHNSSEMTPYQSFDWNKKLLKCYRSNTYIFLNFKVKFVVCYRNSVPVIIAPLAIPKFSSDSSAYIQILGQYSKSGTLNFIYSDDSDDEDFDFIISFIKNKYKKNIRFYEISDYTKFNNHLSKSEKYKKISSRKCVRCSLPSTTDEYYNSLSKSVRQTIRTSYNRLQKDNLDSHIEIHRGFNFSGEELNAIYYLMRKRDAEWNHKSVTEIKQNKENILHRILHNVFKNYDPFFYSTDCKNFIYVKYIINGSIAAFFIALINNNGICIVPTLIHNSDFSKYSPGLLMIYEFLNYSISNKNVTVFDLSRGCESYKYRYIPNPQEYINNDYLI